MMKPKLTGVDKYNHAKITYTLYEDDVHLAGLYINQQMLFSIS